MIVPMVGCHFAGLKEAFTTIKQQQKLQAKVGLCVFSTSTLSGKTNFQCFYLFSDKEIHSSFFLVF